MTGAQVVLTAAFALACYGYGYHQAHLTILEECKRLGSFYVGKSIVIVKEIKEYKP